MLYPNTLVLTHLLLSEKNLESRIYAIEKRIEQQAEFQKYIVKPALVNAKDLYRSMGINKYSSELQQLKKLAEEKPGRVHMVIIFEDENQYPLILGVQQELLPFEKEGVQGGIHARMYYPTLTCSLEAVRQITSRTHRFTYISSSNNLEDYVWDLMLLDKEMLITFNPDLMKPEDFIALGWQGILSNDVFSMAIVTIKT